MLKKNWVMTLEGSWGGSFNKSDEYTFYASWWCKLHLGKGTFMNGESLVRDHFRKVWKVGKSFEILLKSCLNFIT